MKKRMWAVVCVMLCVTGILFATGASETSQGATKSSEPITLEWWTWDPTMEAQNNEIIAKFEAENPGVKIHNTIVPTSEYWTKIRIQATQNTLPDVYTMSSGYLEEWAKAGLMYNLDTFISKDNTKEIFYPAMLDVVKTISASDHTYALPFALVTPMLFYNKDMFDKAGVAYPNETWTWDDFTKAAKQLTKDTNGDGKTDQWGFWFYGRYAHIEPWVYANGGNLIDRKTMRFAPDANALEALKMLTGMVLSDKSAPPQKEMSALNQQQVFMSQKAAMWVDGSWFVDTIRKTVGDDFQWGMTSIPVGPNGSSDVIYAWPDSYSIAPNTKNPEMAWKFCRYVAGEGIDLSTYMAGKIPSCKALAENSSFVDLNQQPGDQMTLLRGMAGKAMKTSYTQGWSEWRGYGASETLGLNGMIDAILNGDLTFSDALQKGTADINTILSRYYK